MISKSALQENLFLQENMWQRLPPIKCYVESENFQGNSAKTVGKKCFAFLPYHLQVNISGSQSGKVGTQHQSQDEWVGNYDSCLNHSLSFASASWPCRFAGKPGIVVGNYCESGCVVPVWSTRTGNIAATQSRASDVV